MIRRLPNFTRQPRIRGKFASPLTTWTRINAQGKEETRELVHFSVEVEEEPTVMELLGRLVPRAAKPSITTESTTSTTTTNLPERPNRVGGSGDGLWAAFVHRFRWKSRSTGA